MSQNFAQQKAVMNNSSPKKQNTDSNALEMQKGYTLKQIRELVFLIRTKSKGKLSFQEISRQCGWTPSRLNQILNNFKKYFPKKKKFQDAIWEKLNNQLDSLNRETIKGVDKNEEQIIQN